MSIWDSLFGDADGKMSIAQCQELAKRVLIGEPTAKISFDLVGPKGRIHCVWLDAFLGLLQEDGSKSFISVQDLILVHSLHVEEFNADSDMGTEVHDANAKAECDSSE